MKRSTTTVSNQGMRVLLLLLALLLTFAGCNTTEPPIDPSPNEESSNMQSESESESTVGEEELPTVLDDRTAPYYERDGLFINYAIAIPETPPFPLPEFQLIRKVYENSQIEHLYTDVTDEARENYYQMMQQEGYVVEAVPSHALLYREGCAIFLDYGTSPAGSVSASLTYFVQQQDVSQDCLTPKQAYGKYFAYQDYSWKYGDVLIDVTPKKLFERTGGQIFMRVMIEQSPQGVLYVPGFYFVSDSSLLKLSNTQLAWADADGNGIEERYLLGKDPLSKNLQTVLTAYEENGIKAKKTFQGTNYFFTVQDGKLCVTNPETEKKGLPPYEIIIKDGNHITLVSQYVQVYKPADEEKEAMEDSVAAILAKRLLEKEETWETGTKECIGAGLMDFNFDGVPEVLELSYDSYAYENTVIIEVYDLYTGKWKNIFQALYQEGRIVDICIYKSVVENSFSTLEISKRSDEMYSVSYVNEAIVTGAILSVSYVYTDIVKNGVLSFVVSGEQYSYKGDLLSREEYIACCESFFESQEKLESTQLQVILWDSINADNHEQRAEKMAKKLLASNQEYIIYQRNYP